MATFEDFLSEGKKIQIKRKYTENYPAKTVGKTANVRNAVIQAIKDGVVTREEFNKILSELSTSSSQWASRNRKYFNVSEEGIKLSKWGRRILAELDETPKAAEVFEKIKVTKDKFPYIEFKDGGKKYEVDFDQGDIIDDHDNEGKDWYYVGVDQFGDEWEIDVYTDSRDEPEDWFYDTIKRVDESKVNEAKFVKEFDKAVLDAETEKDVLKVYPKAEFYVGKMSHFFGELEPNLFFKAYYAKYYKQDTGKSIKGDFKITTVYSEKGSKYVNLHLEESVVTEGKGFKNTEDFEAFLKEIDSMPEAQIKKIMGKDYIDTPGFYEDEKDDYADVTDFMMSNMGRKEFQKLQDWWETNVAESVVNEKDDAGDHLDKLAELVGKAKDFMSVGKELKKGKYKYDFGTGMMPHYQVEADGFTFMILNKRYVDKGDREVGDIAIGLLENMNTNMKNEINLFESFSDFVGANFLNEAINSAILRTVLSNGREGKQAKKNLSQLAKGFYGLSKVALDKIQDEDFIVSNDVSKVFKNYGGSSHVLFFISDNEKENPYYDHNNGSWNDYKVVPGGGVVLAAMSGDRQFYANEWSRWSGGRAWSKNKKGDEGQIGINHKYRGWGASGLNNGKRISEVSDRVIVINLELIRQKYSTDQLRNARKEARAGATAFKSDKDFKDANTARYHKILADKAASLPLDKMVSDAIDKLAKQISDGLAKGEKTRYQEIKIGESPKGREVKAKDASQHMSNILDDYARYVDYIRQAEESEARYGERESYYERESKNYAKNIKERINKIDSFDYAW